MEDYSEMTDEQFDAILQDLVEKNVKTLLSIPGVYEAVSEHFNNEVLSHYDEVRRRYDYKPEDE